MSNSLPLTAARLNRIKGFIKEYCEMWGVDEVPVDLNQLNSCGSTRRVHEVEDLRLPLEAALQMLEGDKIGKVEGKSFKVIKPEELGIAHFNFPVPLRFSIAQRIREDAQVMTELYLELYDIENRLRYFVSTVLQKLHGDDWYNQASVVPKKVRESIEAKKKKLVVALRDPRVGVLDFSEFGNLLAIIQNNNEGVFKKCNESNVGVYLEYLEEARNIIAHSNVLNQEERTKFKQYAQNVRNMITQASV